MGCDDIPEGGYRHASGNVSHGTKRKTGRRPARLAIPKQDLYDLIIRLHERGLGQHSIAFLLGYSHAGISRHSRCIGLEKHTGSTMVRAIIRHLPPDLVSDCRRVKMRSDIAHERAAIRQGLVKRERQVHICEDDDNSTSGET